MFIFATLHQHEELIFITLVALFVWKPAMVNSGFLHPGLDYKQPRQRQTLGQTVQVDETTTVISIQDAAVSFLFKVKVYPFRPKTSVETARATARFGGPETGVVNRIAGNNGVMAFGVDLWLPGEIGGLGYGHQMPFQTYSVSSFQRHSNQLDQEL